jgi:hypothetical protein
MRSAIVWLSLVFYPLFSLFAIADFFGANYFQAFFTGIAYPLCGFVFVLLPVILSYWMWEGRTVKLDTVFAGHYILSVCEWMWLLFFELVTVTVQVWTWYSQYKTGDISVVAINRVIDQPIAAYVYWKNILVTILAILSYHVYLGGKFYQATTMLSALSHPKGSKGA